MINEILIVKGLIAREKVVESLLKLEAHSHAAIVRAKYVGGDIKTSQVVPAKLI